MMTGKTEKVKTRIVTLSMHSLLERHHLDAAEPVASDQVVAKPAATSYGPPSTTPTTRRAFRRPGAPTCCIR